MDWLIIEIALGLAVAFILGTFFGWFLRGRGNKVSNRNLEVGTSGNAELEVKNSYIADLEEKLRIYNKDIDGLNDKINHLDSENIELRNRKPEVIERVVEKEVKVPVEVKTGPTPTVSSLVAEATPAKAAPKELYKIEEIEGIGKVYGTKMRSLGVDTTDKLLNQIGRDRDKQKEAADLLNIDLSEVNDFVSMADLLRVVGVDKQFAELINTAEVNNVQTLAKQSNSSFFNLLKKVNEETRVSPDTPTKEDVERIIDNAKLLRSRIDN